MFTGNAFEVSRESISPIIRRVSHAVTNFRGPQLMKLPKLNKVKDGGKITGYKFLETHGFRSVLEPLVAPISE